MASSYTRPLIGIPASLLEIAYNRMHAHAAGEKYVESLARFADCVPVILPALGEAQDAGDLSARIDGLFLTGGRANVEPHHYDGSPFPDDEPIDPARDDTVLPLIRACLHARVPIFGICRGIQELNVALGGTLHYRVHLVPGKEDHRMPRHEGVTREEIFALRHPVRLAASGLFRDLAGADECMVNSLHGQAIDRLGDGLEIEATSPDGIVEGVRLTQRDAFAVAVQWHAEWQPAHHDLSRKLFEAFGDAARKCARRRALGPAGAPGQRSGTSMAAG